MKVGVVLERGCVGDVKIREGREVWGMGIVQRDLRGIVVARFGSCSLRVVVGLGTVDVGGARMVR